jgi:hypothetical protein
MSRFALHTASLLLASLANAAFMLRSANNLQKCLDFPGGGAKGSTMQIWDCNGGDNQQFELHASGQIVNAANGWCLDVLGGFRTDPPRNGRGVGLWDCTAGADNQAWQVKNAPDGLQHVVLRAAPGFGLNNQNNVVANGNPVALWQVDNTKASAWFLDSV